LHNVNDAAVRQAGAIRWKATREVDGRTGPTCHHRLAWPEVGVAQVQVSRSKDDSGSGSERIFVGFWSCGFEFGDDFSPTVFGFGIGFGFGFGFPPVDIQWISEINHLELKLMFYNMLIITWLLRLLSLFKIDS
jgi:hypothetical protein